MSLKTGFHNRIRQFVKLLQRFMDRIWYPPLLGVLAVADAFIIVIPNDGILISSSMLKPSRWIALALFMAIGSTLGAFILAVLVEVHGMPFILKMYPTIEHTSAWLWTVKFFDVYGLFLVFAVAATPFVQQPVVILAALSHTPLIQIGLVMLLGRTLKYLLMAYIASHAPRLITKIWGVKGELKDVGVKVE